MNYITTRCTHLITKNNLTKAVSIKRFHNSSLVLFSSFITSCWPFCITGTLRMCDRFLGTPEIFILFSEFPDVTTSSFHSMLHLAFGGFTKTLFHGITICVDFFTLQNFLFGRLIRISWGIRLNFRRRNLSIFTGGIVVQKDHLSHISPSSWRHSFDSPIWLRSIMSLPSLVTISACICESPKILCKTLEIPRFWRRCHYHTTIQQVHLFHKI